MTQIELRRKRVERILASTAQWILLSPVILPCEVLCALVLVPRWLWLRAWGAPDVTYWPRRHRMQLRK